MLNSKNSGSNEEADDDFELPLPSAIGHSTENATRFAEALGAAVMTRPMTRPGPGHRRTASRTANDEEEVSISALAEVGALPPPDEEAAENAPDRDVDVLSDVPEVDTTRADVPPSKWERINAILRRAFINACLISCLLWGIVATVLLVNSHVTSVVCLVSAIGNLIDSNSTFVRDSLNLSPDAMRAAGCNPNSE